MYTNQIRLNVQNFRAIEEADILLNGITVVAGENGCGKSTLSKFLYYVFKNSNEYSRLVDKELTNRLQQFSYLLDMIREELFSNLRSEDTEGALKSWSMYTDLIKEKRHLDQSFWHEYMEELGSRYRKTAPNSSRLLRLKMIVGDVLGLDTNETDFEGLSMLITDRIDELFEQSKIEKQQRNAELLKKELRQIFSTSSLPQKYKIAEYDSVIIADEEQTFVKSHTIQQVAYLDTPMSLDIQGGQYPYWDDLNRILHDLPEREGFNNQINQLIVNDILKGNTTLEELDTADVFTYQREDGSKFSLLECATGIKSFAILQMLLKNGFLNKYTLMIIDEPESHLHPQWIIEYARLIVLLNKHVGVKFFIASHNPDMVSAIKYISEKEETDHKLNFYIAEQNKPLYQYKYKHLGTDIEPIFESFNIALDRISQYGTKEETEE